MHKLLQGVIGAFGLAAVMAFAAPASAQGANDPEMACVSAVADKTGASMEAVMNNGKRRVGEGTEVRLSVGRDNYNCYANDDGEVTSVEKRVAAAAPARPRRAAVTPAQLRANCKTAANKYLNLAGAQVTLGESRDVGDQVEIDASYYGQSVTCTVVKATGRVLNVG